MKSLLSYVPRWKAGESWAKTWFIVRCLPRS
nr:MAG TPA: hypothetical protein [Caudoviricetes sp.]